MSTATAKNGIQRSFGNITAGDFTTGRVNIGGPIAGPWFINYTKVGNLYFSFWWDDLPSNAVGTIGVVNPFGVTPPTLEAAQIAASIGITVDTIYYSQNYGQGCLDFQNTVTWNYNAPTNQYNSILTGILAA